MSETTKKRRDELRAQFKGLGGFVGLHCTQGGPTVDELMSLIAHADDTPPQRREALYSFNLILGGCFQESDEENVRRALSEPAVPTGYIERLQNERDEALAEKNELKRRLAEPAVPEAVNVVFDGPPGPNPPHFVEVETDDGKGVRVGEWIERPDGMWALRIERDNTVPDAVRKLPKRWRASDLIDASRSNCARELERALAQHGEGRVPEKPLGAIHNAEAFLDRLENHYSFECVAGTLSQCTDWLELRRCFDALREYVAAAPDPGPEKNDE